MKPDYVHMKRRSPFVVVAPHFDIHARCCCCAVAAAAAAATATTAATVATATASPDWGTHALLVRGFQVFTVLLTTVEERGSGK